MNKKLIFLIADGMGDYPLFELAGKTPLQAANTPNIDLLAQYGYLGQCCTIPSNMTPGSDTANMSLLGYNPRQYHTGRGPIEASAQGLELNSEDLIYRLNLCTISELSAQGVMLDYSAGHIDTNVAQHLIGKLKAALDDEIFTIVPGLQYRHLLVQKQGTKAFEHQIEINPPHDITNQSLAQDLQAFAQSTSLMTLMQKAAQILSNNGEQTKANAVWPWGQGKPMTLPSFQNTFGYQGAIISAVDLLKGLGKAAGMQILDIPGATGLLDTNYQGKIEAAIDFLGKFDFVYLHVEAPDECSHKGDINGKIEAIERFDQKIVKPLTQYINQLNIACIIACDHLTPISLKTHTADPIPFLFCDSLEKIQNPEMTFNENTATQTGLFIEHGHHLIPWIINRFGEKNARERHLS